MTKVPEAIERGQLSLKVKVGPVGSRPVRVEGERLAGDVMQAAVIEQGQGEGTDIEDDHLARSSSRRLVGPQGLRLNLFGQEPCRE